MVEVAKPSAWIPMEDGGTVSVSGRRGRYFAKSENIRLEDDARIFFDEQGKREWILFGETASYIREEEAFYISGLRGTLYPASGETVEISAENGRYDSGARTMKVRNDVRCMYSQGIILETDELDYEVDENVARTDDNIIITGKAFKLRGRGLFADLETNEIVVKKSVRLKLDKGMGGVK
jgi:LPS export ABC transporter protein LptC